MEFVTVFQKSIVQSTISKQEETFRKEQSQIYKDLYVVILA